MILIIGAGQAGMAVARALRELGHTGGIRLIGDESIAPYERPPLSKQHLAEATAPQPALFAANDWWHQNDVGLILGRRVVGIDRIGKLVHLDAGTSLPYKHLVIATGGRARPLPVGASLRSAADARSLAQRLATSRRVCVVGGGFLGLEIAASARSRGLDVVVLEAAPRLLPRVLPLELSDWLRALHARHGTEVHCGLAVSEVVETPDGFSVQAGPLIVDSECLVGAVGMAPNTELALAAGLDVDGGIVVDADCRTSDPDVYAVGDVASVLDASGGLRRVESWQNADHQGAVAASHIHGAPRPAAPVPWFWTEQYGASIQVLGDLLSTGELVWRGDPAGPAFSVALLREDRVVGAFAANAGRDVPPLRQLIASGETVGASALRSARNLRDVLRARG